MINFSSTCSDSDALSVGAIVGIVIGVLAGIGLLIAIIVIIIICLKKKNNRPTVIPQQQQLQQQQQMQGISVNYGMGQPWQQGYYQQQPPGPPNYSSNPSKY